MARCRVALAAAAVVVLLASCATPTVVAEPAGAPAPYDGPLHLTETEAATAAERLAGAAGRAVQCRSAASGGTNDPAGYAGEVGSTPEMGLKEALDEGSISGPPNGWHRDRTDGDRTMFTVTVGTQRKAVAILAHGPVLGNQNGWFAESYAYCNLAEFPPEVAAKIGNELWTDAAGVPVDTRTIVSFRGPEHCSWTAMTFLSLRGGDLDGGGKGRTYVRNAQPDYVGDYFAEPYQQAVTRPGDAVDTGFRRDGQQLWLSKDGRRAYVGSPDSPTAELWPRTIQPLGCA